MNNRKYKKILSQIAKKHGVSVEEVQRDMELAVKASQMNPDPKVQAKLALVPRKGDTPTAAETIEHLGREVQERLDKE